MEPNSPHGDTQSIQPPSDPREIARQNLQRPNEASARPECIGPYKILVTLGEGGMGVVYLAEQSKPIHRRVALKIIKLGMDTKQVIARFETEREALALMNHPNVAKVFDAGATETGRPYFVMEYVAGIPITEYCDKHRLTTGERLRLFMDVCHAVQHAHQKGIIHRDIKPSNVLVSVDPSNPPLSPLGKGGGMFAPPLDKGGGMFAPPLDKGGLGGVAVKVIDFGVAKATQHRLTERTLFTEQGQLVGTPGYMSPEQAEMTALDIDTRTDIYSLGVILYELLAGALPFDPASLRAAGFAEIQRIIREVDPPKPSTKLSMIQSESAAPAAGKPPPLLRGDSGGLPLEPETHAQRSASTRGSSIEIIAHRRHTEPKTLIRQIRGDLDWIVMRAMEKDRTRRYDTANAIAVEIQRYLNHEPVLAGPPSAGYRLRKFVRRNRGPVAAGVMVAIVLVGGLVGTSYGLAQAVRAREAEAEQRLIAEEREREAVAAREAEAGQRRIAEEREKEATEARDRARDEAAKATRIQEFLKEMLASADPQKAKGAEFTVREVLDEAAQRIGSQLKDQPGVEAAVRHTIGLAYAYLGRHKEAKEHFEIAVRLRRDPEVADELDLADSLLFLGALVERTDKDLARSRAMHNEALAIRERRLGKDHPLTVELLGFLAQTQRNAADEPGYWGLAAEVIRRMTGKTSSDEELIAEYEQKLDQVSELWRQGRREEALSLIRSEMRPLVDSGLPMYAVVGGLLYVSYHRERASDYDAAEPFLHEAVRIAREANEPMYIAQALGRLGLLHLRKRDYAEAAECLSEVLELEKRIFGDEHSHTLGTMNNLANALSGQGRYPDAEELRRKTLEIQRRVLGEDHTDTLASMNNLATSLNNQGRYAEAEELYRQTLEMQRRVLGEEHPDTLKSMNSVANRLANQARYAEAEELYRKTLEIQRRLLGDEHSHTLSTMSYLAYSLNNQGRYAEAEELYRNALDIQRRVWGEEHPSTLGWMNNVADSLMNQGNLQEAEELCRETVDTARRVLGDQHALFALPLVTLAEVLIKKGESHEAEPIVNEALQIRQATLPDNHFNVVYAQGVLGECLTAQGRFDEAEPLLVQTYAKLKAARGEKDQEAVKDLARIIELYESWDAAEPGKGYAEKAAEWRAKLETMQPPKSESADTPKP